MQFSHSDKLKNRLFLIHDTIRMFTFGFAHTGIQVAHINGLCGRVYIILNQYTSQLYPTSCYTKFPG